jgi:hypothetical protein
VRDRITRLALSYFTLFIASLLSAMLTIDTGGPAWVLVVTCTLAVVGFSGMVYCAVMFMDAPVYINYPQVDKAKHYVPKPMEGREVDLQELKHQLYKDLGYKKRGKKFRVKKRRFDSEGNIIE